MNYKDDNVRSLNLYSNEKAVPIFPFNAWVDSNVENN